MTRSGASNQITRSQHPPRSRVAVPIPAPQEKTRTVTDPVQHNGGNGHQRDKELRRAAVVAARRGWHVIPLARGEKRPIIEQWESAATADELEARAAFSPRGEWAGCNVGIACGPSGLVVLDLDVKDGKNGPDELRKLCTDLGLDFEELCETYSVHTPSGGDHLYFRPPEGVRIGSRPLAPGIDVRAWGGQVVAAGSRNGRGAYEVLRELPVAELPAALVQRLNSGGAEPRSSSAPPIPEVIPQGERETTLVSMAGSMRRRGMSPEAILAALEVENDARCVPPVEQADLERIAHSVGRYEPEDVPRTGQERADELGREVRRERIRAEAREIAQRELAARHRAPLPAFRNLAQLLDEPDDPTRYRVHGLLPTGGNAVLVAKDKAGKTHLRDNLVRSLVDGDDFLDRFAVVPLAHRVVVLDTEMSEGTARRWFRDQRITNTEQVVFVGLRGGVSALDLRDPDVVSSWAEQLCEAECELLILDCLGPVLASLGMDENSSRDVGQFLAGWDRMLQQAGVTESLVVHHMGHQGERARGASRLNDWPDAKWQIVFGRDGKGEPVLDGPRYFGALGRDVDVPPLTMEYDPDTRRLRIPTGASSRGEAVRAQREQHREQTLSQTLDAVLEFLQRSDGATSRALREGVSGSNRRIDQAVALGLERGQIRQALDGPAKRHWLVREAAK